MKGGAAEVYTSPRKGGPARRTIGRSSADFGPTYIIEEIALRGEMGTEITLDVGEIWLTYSKNHRGMDHGSLYEESDRKPIRSDQLEYAYYKEHDEDPTSAEMAFIRPLKDVVPRIELLGFTLDRVRREYEMVAQSWREEKQAMLDDEGSDRRPNPMSFAEFYEFATYYPLLELDNTFVSDAHGKEKGTIRGRFANTPVDRIPGYDAYDIHAYSERTYFRELVNVLHAYSVLRILGEKKENGDAPVVWQYGPLVEAGWATEQDFRPSVRRSETFLIATEGSSDVYVLKHALALLRPGIADFFRFIDVSESHPFSGTGNLVKFAEGLAKIDVQNQVLFLFDNDAEGVGAQQRLSKLKLPSNMRATMLPEIETFRAFRAQGPEGLRTTDINRRAAGIECYLDLTVGSHGPAKIIWTNYKKDLGVYQGALEYKDFYVREFLKQTPRTIANRSYDTSKVQAVLDLIVAECTAISVGRWDPSGGEHI